MLAWCFGGGGERTSSMIWGILTGWVEGQSPPTLFPVKRAGPFLGYATWDWRGVSELLLGRI